MDFLQPIIAAIRHLLQSSPALSALLLSMKSAIVVYVGLAVVIIGIERLAHRDLDRYKTRDFVNDIAYTLFYQGGLYNVFFYAPLFAWLSPHLSFAHLGLVEKLPGWLSVIVYWLILDLMGYWVHRIQHTVPSLWAFHSVHHTAKRMTALTTNRNHLLESIYVNVFMLMPVLFLGMPAKRWMPVYFAQIFFELVQHSQLRWTYGPLRYVIVSPAFHVLHHSTEERQYNGNYSKILAIWDLIFGSYVGSGEEPTEIGVTGMDVRETLTAQFLHPFRVLRGERRTAAQPLETEPASTA